MKRDRRQGDGIEIVSSFNRVGNAPRVGGELASTSLNPRGVAHAVKRGQGARPSYGIAGFTLNWDWFESGDGS